MAALRGDDERTVVSSPRPTSDTPSKTRSKWPWVTMVGCAVVLCMVLVVVIAAILVTRDGELPIRLGAVTATPTHPTVHTPTSTRGKATATAQAELEPTATKPPTTRATSGATQSPSPTPKPTQRTTATATPVSLEPLIGPITFAISVTDDNQPVDPGMTFPADIEEIHAVFSYEGMSESDTWGRNWYQDGEEVGAGSGTWDAGESGTFDLSLTGGDEPLGAGTWKLEIHVNEELVQTGTFVIEASAIGPGSLETETYEVAFARWDGVKHDVYIANTDGSGERFLL